MPKHQILVIEDERDLVEVLTYNLTKEGYEVISANDGKEGLQRAQLNQPDLILLDLMLPGMDGLEVCRQIRADSRTQNCRVLMLTARSEDVDEIVGFNMGADDYVTKPFKVKPLVHRVKALLRRGNDAESESEIIVAHSVEVDRINHVARCNDEELLLTPTEFRLLWTFVRQPGRPYSRHELMDTSRGEDANALERTIDVHIRALRQKLGNNSGLIETVRGIGYRFRPVTESKTRI